MFNTAQNFKIIGIHFIFYRNIWHHSFLVCKALRGLSSIAPQNAQPILGNSSMANNKQNICSILPQISKSWIFISFISKISDITVTYLARHSGGFLLLLLKMLNLFWETQVWLITSKTIVQYCPKFQNHRNSFHLLPKYLTSQLLTLQGTQEAFFYCCLKCSTHSGKLKYG